MREPKKPTWTHNFYIFCGLLCLIELGSSNKYDPHFFPKQGPFFEGWYLRLFDFDTADSLGFLFGHVLPEVNAPRKDPLVFSSVLFRTNCTSGTCVLNSSNARFDVSQSSITKYGKPVVTNPDDTSPSGFEWNALSTNARCSFVNREYEATLNLTFGNTSFFANIGLPVPWGPAGEGPEGWLDDLPFVPLHWFVYSLRSPIKYYEFRDDDKKVYKTGTRGTVHMEKNWGTSFPKSWIWSQGILRNSDISFVVSGGPVDLESISVTAFLFGYRNPSKHININFRPSNSLATLVHNGCHGYANLTIRGLLHEVHVVLSGEVTSFSQCLFGPERTGFRRACVESYDAKAIIDVYENDLFSSKLIDKQIIPFSALEFGGNFVCDKKCT